jgi:hypothetical protein
MLFNLTKIERFKYNAGYRFRVFFELDGENITVDVTTRVLLNYKNFRRDVLFETGHLYFNSYVERQIPDKVEAAWYEELNRLLAQNN